MSVLPPVDQSLLPADIRTAPTQVKQQYQAALSFEQSLVSELTKQLSQTAGSSLEDSPYAQLLPDALSDAITAGGGLGLAREMVTVPTTAAGAASTGGAAV